MKNQKNGHILKWALWKICVSFLEITQQVFIHVPWFFHPSYRMRSASKTFRSKMCKLQKMCNCVFIISLKNIDYYYSIIDYYYSIHEDIRFLAITQIFFGQSGWSFLRELRRLLSIDWWWESWFWCVLKN